MNQPVKTCNMKTAKKSQLGGVVVGVIFVVFALSVMTGALDLEFLREAWRSSVLGRLVPTRDTAFIYAIIGIVIGASSLIPDKYSEARIYADRLEMRKRKGETENYEFANIGDMNVSQPSKGGGKYLHLVLKNSGQKIQIGCSHNSEMPESALEAWKKYGTLSS